MCGLFGYVGTGAKPGLLAACAREAARRGPHSFGWATYTPAGVQIVRRAGPLTDEAVRSLIETPAQGIIGVCRLATFGSWRIAANNQPIHAGPIWLVHNGNFYNAPALAKEYGVTPESESDTEILGLVIGKLPGGLQARVRAALALAQPPTRQAVLVLDPPYVLAESQGHSLYAYHDDSGIYFCSRPLTAQTGLERADASALLRIGGPSHE